jgi:inner membrane protein involved in colicin E2 resistance
VSLYTTTLTISGTFDNAKLFSTLKSNSKGAIAKSTVMFNISDLRGITGEVKLHWNSKKIDVNPGLSDQSVFKSGFVSNINLEEQQKNYSFTLKIKLNGSQSLEFLPLGKYTSVKMKSSWNNPGFMGSFLPSTHKIDNNGFEASWNINHFNRDYPQEWINKYYNVMESSFGLRLLMPVDEYQKTTRTSKYGIMIVLLTFISFYNRALRQSCTASNTIFTGWFGNCNILFPAAFHIGVPDIQLFIFDNIIACYRVSRFLCKKYLRKNKIRNHHRTATYVFLWLHVCYSSASGLFPAFR